MSKEASVKVKRYRQFEIASELVDTGEEMVLASDYDALLALARRLRKALISDDELSAVDKYSVEKESAWLEE